MLRSEVIVVNSKYRIDPFPLGMPLRHPTLHPNRIERLRIRHLKLLELIGTRGSLTSAASTLDIGQPAASKLLRDLEDAFGQTLVDRSARGGTLSAAGERVLERLRIATGALDAIEDAMAAAVDIPLVRVGMLPLAGVSLVPRLVARLAQDGALPRLQLREGPVHEVLGLLREGQIDCVLGRLDRDLGEHGAGAYDILTLNDEHFEVACGPGHPLARKRKLELHHLRDQSWILPPFGTYTREVLDAAFVSAGVMPPVARIESRSFHVSLATVTDTRLLTIAPRGAVDFYASLGRVRRVHLANPFQPDYVVFVTLRGPSQLPSIQLIKMTLQRLTA